MSKEDILYITAFKGPNIELNPNWSHINPHSTKMAPDMFYI